MNTIKKVITINLISFLLFPGCEKQELGNQITAEEQTENLTLGNNFIDYILSIGLSKDSITEITDYYIVEGDILFPKKKDYHPKLKQAYITSSQGTLLAWENQDNITVRVNNNMPTAGVDNWRPSIQNAINEWNNINDTRISFRLIESDNADITITADGGQLPGNVIAAGSWPDGIPGSTITINLDFNNNMTLTEGQMRYNTVHELGHCIGLRHTNWSTRGEGTAYTIPSTPSEDANSVMNGGTALNGWNGFSGFDIRALNVLYPQSYYNQLGGAVWNGTKAMTSLNGWVYLVQNSRFYRISGTDGSYTQLGGAVWSGTEAMTSLNGWIYLVQNSRLYRVSSTNGSYTQIGGAVWSGTDAMTSLNGWLYIVENSRLYRVNSITGVYNQIGGANWGGVNSMTAQNGWVYLIQNSYLHKTNPGDGSYTILGWSIWSGTEAMTAMTNNLYVVQNSRFYSIVDVD